MSGPTRRAIILSIVVISATLAMVPPASAYVVNTTASGKEIRWLVRSVPFLLNGPDGPAGTVEAVQAAMQTWTDVPTSSFAFAYAGTTTSSAYGKNDGQNIVSFAHMAAGTLAENTFWFSSSTGRIADSDICFNLNYSWSVNGSPGTYDVQNIGTHELGHSLSLDDLYAAADEEKTMYGYGSAGETDKRSLHPDDIGGIAHIYPNGGLTGDFDGDGKTDVAIFRPSNGTWHIVKSAGGFIQTAWGAEGDVPVPGDYDKDTIADIAVFRPSNGTWYVVKSAGGVMETAWGAMGDTPVPGDYDGDGITDLAVFRPSNGTWYVVKSAGGFIETTWGTLGDTPVPGDYDGDGITDLAVFRSASGMWYVVKSTGGFIETPWGAMDDTAVPGDYDGDGKTDIGIFRSTNSTWYVAGSGGGFLEIPWGAPGDVPAPANFNGAARANIAVFRPFNGTWYVLGATGAATEVPWGISTDLPVFGR